MFGEKLDDTYAAAKERVENPPRLNIWLPSMAGKKDENKEYAKSSENIKKGKLIFLTHGFRGEPARWDYMIKYLKNSGIKLVHLGEIEDSIVTRKNTAIKSLNSKDNFKSETESIINTGQHVIFTLDMGRFKYEPFGDNDGTVFGRVHNLSRELGENINCVRPNGQKIILVGHSLGGLINMGYATAYLLDNNNDNFDKIEKMVSFNTPYNGALYINGAFSSAVAPEGNNLSKYWNSYYKSGKFTKGFLTAIASIDVPFSIKKVIEETPYYPIEVEKITYAHDNIVSLSSQLGQDKHNIYEGLIKIVAAHSKKDTEGMGVAADDILYTKEALDHSDTTESSVILDYFIKLLGV